MGCPKCGAELVALTYQRRIDGQPRRGRAPFGLCSGCGLPATPSVAYVPDATESVGYAPSAGVGYAPPGPVGYAPSDPVGYAPPSAVAYAPAPAARLPGQELEDLVRKIRADRAAAATAAIERGLRAAGAARRTPPDVARAVVDARDRLKLTIGEIQELLDGAVGRGTIHRILSDPVRYL